MATNQKGSTFYLFSDEEENEYTWTTAARKLELGEAYEVIGTIKALSKYKGIDYIYKKFNDIKKEMISYIARRNQKLIERTKIISTEELASLEKDIESIETQIGNWNYIDSNFIFGDKIGRLCILYDEFKNTFLKNTVNYINYPKEPLKTVYEAYIEKQQEKNNFWYEFKKEYEDIWIEGYFENELEVDSESLYEQAKIYFLDYMKPQEEVGITYIDLSQIIGKNIELIKVGDIIKISNMQGILDSEEIELQVTSISRNLRNSADIALTIDKSRRNQIILEKLLLGLKK
jgi:hypothetical protein